jgi:hypothetical protein
MGRGQNNSQASAAPRSQATPVEGFETNFEISKSKRLVIGIKKRGSNNYHIRAEERYIKDPEQNKRAVIAMNLCDDSTKIADTIRFIVENEQAEYMRAANTPQSVLDNFAAALKNLPTQEQVDKAFEKFSNGVRLKPSEDGFRNFPDYQPNKRLKLSGGGFKNFPDNQPNNLVILTKGILEKISKDPVKIALLDELEAALGEAGQGIRQNALNPGFIDELTPAACRNLQEAGVSASTPEGAEIVTQTWVNQVADLAGARLCDYPDQAVEGLTGITGITSRLSSASDDLYKRTFSRPEARSIFAEWPQGKEAVANKLHERIAERQRGLVHSG